MICNITNVIRQIFLLRPLQNLIWLTPSAWNALRLRKHIYKRLNFLLRSWRTRWRANTGFQKGEKASNTLITRLGNFKMMWGVVNDFKSVSPRVEETGVALTSTLSTPLIPHITISKFGSLKILLRHSSPCDLKVSLRNLCLFWLFTADDHWRTRSHDPTYERVQFIIKTKQLSGKRDKYRVV